MRILSTLLLALFLIAPPLGSQIQFPVGGSSSVIPYKAWWWSQATGALTTGSFTDAYTYAIQVGESPAQEALTSFNIRWKVGGVAQVGKTYSECGIGYSESLPQGLNTTVDVTIVHAQDCDMTTINTVVTATVAAAVPAGKLVWVILGQSGTGSNPQYVSEDQDALSEDGRVGWMCINTSLQPTTVDDGGAAFTCTNSALWLPWVAVLPS